MVKKKINIIVRLSISCLCVAYLYFLIEWHPIIIAFRKVDILTYVLSTATASLSILMVACKYFFLIRNTTLTHSIWSLTKINFISRFYAIFLPTALGPEMVRWYKVTHLKQGKLLFLTATLLERFTFLIILLLFGFTPLFFITSNYKIIALREQLIPIALPVFVILGLLFLSFIFSGVQRYLREFAKRIISRLLSGSKENWKNQNIILNNNIIILYPCLIGLSLIWQLLFIARMILLFKATQIPLEVLDIAWMASLVLLLQIIPLSMAGIGLREGAYAYLFTLYDLPPEKGILIGLLFFSQKLIMAFVGGVFELMDK